MAIELKVPSVGESVTEIEIGQWLKAEGDAVNKDENIVALESEKATVELPAPASGTLSRIVKRKGSSCQPPMRLAPTHQEVMASPESRGRRSRRCRRCRPDWPPIR